MWNKKQRIIEEQRRVIERSDSHIEDLKIIIIKLRGRKETKIQLFKDKRKDWRFRIVAGNGKILCSSEAYSRKCFAKKTTDLIKNSKFLVVEE